METATDGCLHLHAHVMIRKTVVFASGAKSMLIHSHHSKARFMGTKLAQAARESCSTEASSLMLYDHMTFHRTN